jgi:hypothetical protein
MKTCVRKVGLSDVTHSEWNSKSLLAVDMRLWMLCIWVNHNSCLISKIRENCAERIYLAGVFQLATHFSLFSEHGGVRSISCVEISADLGM